MAAADRLGRELPAPAATPRSQGDGRGLSPGQVRNGHSASEAQRARRASSSSTAATSSRARRAGRTGGRSGRPTPRRGARPSRPARRGRPRPPPRPPSARTPACPRSAASSCTSPPAASRRARRSCATAPARSTRASRVARRPVRAHAHEQRVAVAVVAQLLDRHRVAARRALVPVLLAAAAPEPRLARLARAALGLGVHPREHQHAAGLGVLDDRGAELAAQAASRIGTPSSRSSSRSDVSRSGSSCRIDASSAACATSSASATWRAPPAPPEAITGIETASATARVISRS